MLSGQGRRSWPREDVGWWNKVELLDLLYTGDGALFNDI